MKEPSDMSEWETAKEYDDRKKWEAFDKKEVPLLNELLDEYDRGDIPKEAKWFKFYPTIFHRDSKSPWYCPIEDLDQRSKLRKLWKKRREELITKMMWGKK